MNRKIVSRPFKSLDTKASLSFSLRKTTKMDITRVRHRLQNEEVLEEISLVLRPHTSLLKPRRPKLT